MLRIFRHYVSARAVAFLLIDVVVISGIFFASGSVSPGGRRMELARGSPELSIYLFAAVFIAIAMYSTGAYDKSKLSNYRHLSSRLLVCLLFCLSCLTAAYLGDLFGIATLTRSKEAQFALAVLAIFPALLLARFIYTGVHGRVGGVHRALVVGAGPLAAHVEALVGGKNFSAEIVGYVALPGDVLSVSPQRLVGIDESLVATARRMGAEEIIVLQADTPATPPTPLLECRALGLSITPIMTFWERETRRVLLDSLDVNWFVYADGFRSTSWPNVLVKRMLDIGLSTILLLFSLPILFLAALAIRLESAGDILYRQERVGRHGKTFSIYKLRTMHAEAERGGAPQWARDGDPRITRVGRFLRQTRIDEIPQVFNVLRGDMSFIGPRPERPYFVDLLAAEIPFYQERHRMRPGITGWAQINHPYGASVEDARMKLAYDLYYIKNYSIFVDLLVLLATVQVVLWHKGAR